MVQGIFEKNTPWIQVALAWSGFVKNYWFVLDTGFTGDLQLPFLFAKEMGITANSVVPTTIANGQTIQVPNALAVASMEGIANFVQVALSNGSPLAGINFLSKFGYTAIVDCKHRTVNLTKT